MALLDLTSLSCAFSRMLCRSAIDAQFRTLCLSDSAVAFLEETGRELPEQYRVCFAEAGTQPQDGAFVLCVLPRFFQQTWLG